MAIINPVPDTPLGPDHLKVHDVIRSDDAAPNQSLWVDASGRINTQANGIYIGESYIARDSVSNELNIANIDASNEINYGDEDYDVNIDASNEINMHADVDMNGNSLTNAAGLISQWTNDSSYELQSNKGSALGYASLDGGGKVLVSELPSAVMIYKGTWDASTNTPTLADGSGDAGDVYRVSVAGTQDLGSGSITFGVGDYCIYNGSTWEKSDTTDAVASVNGYTGVVALAHSDINTILGDGEYHLDSATESALTDANAQLSALHTDGTPTFTSVTTDTVRAIDGDGLQLFDDGGNGIFVKDGGNVGFNTTDIESAGSTYKAIEAYASTLVFGASTAGLGLASNAYNDGAWKRKIADEAAMIYMSTSGGIYLRTAGSDSADSTISWTEAIRVHNSGNVSVGTADFPTPASYKFFVKASDTGLADADFYASAVAAFECNGACYLNFVTPNDQPGGIAMQDEDGHTATLDYDHNTNSFRMSGVGWTDTLHITNAVDTGGTDSGYITLSVGGTTRYIRLNSTS